MSFIVTPGQLKRRAELYHQLSTMISAGIPLIQALEMASARPSISGVRRTFLHIIQNLRAGATFTESLQQSEKWLPEFDVALLATGEQSGRLDSVFNLLAQYYGERAQIVREMLSRLLLTMVTLHVFLLIFPLTYLVSFVVGLFNSNYGQCIPFLIQKTVLFGSAYAGVLLLIYACQSRHGESWRAMVESIAQTVPIFRTAQKYLVLARLSASLEALISAGVSIHTSWELASAASGSAHLKQRVTCWKKQMEMGSTPSEMINQERYFPEVFANLYHTGEASGQLDDSLLRLSHYYQEEGFHLLRRFTGIMNGTIYGLVVLLVAYNIIQFYMGYFANVLNNY